ncbi:hypothetical protein PanWU01x14_015750 [Parasponia andersonii]|uniref:Transmembrane protein n=1 Tax=Parasponia andersonii TaxID=3476 RepID=A0A2P5E0K0_PARAD|nr:hypothetical protein PanWU01x14_015750 [Parasponia andersonii]
MPVFPLWNLSLRGNIDEFLFPKKPLLALDAKRFVALTIVPLVFLYLAAIALPNVCTSFSTWDQPLRFALPSFFLVLLL